jgi:hypothetical protein
MAMGSVVMWTTAAAWTRCCWWQRCGHRRATRSCGPPQSDGRAKGAQTAAGNGELIGEDDGTVNSVARLR